MTLITRIPVILSSTIALVAAAPAAGSPAPNPRVSWGSLTEIVAASMRVSSSSARDGREPQPKIRYRALQPSPRINWSLRPQARAAGRSKA